MATLVVTSEEEPTLVIAKFIAETAWSDAGDEVAAPHIEQFRGEAEALLASNQSSELVTLLLSSADIVISRAAEKDCECVFAIISNFVAKASTPAEAEALTHLIAGKLIGQPAEKPALRLKLLLALHNLAVNPRVRFDIYMKVLRFAVAGKVTDLVISSFKRIETLLREWNLGQSEQRALFLTVSNILRDAKGQARESFTYLLKFLGTFSESAPATPGEGREEAARAALQFIKAPDLFQSDLLDVPPVQQLASNEKYQQVFELLKIFLTGRLDSYLAFQSANGNFLESQGLVHEDCIMKMRLMSLSSLANEGPSREIPYSFIAKTLQVGDDEVEFWIVRAISSKVLEAKMNQMREVVLINRCAQRVFGPSQWLELHSQLASWKENLAGISRGIQTSLADSEAVGQVAAY